MSEDATAVRATKPAHYWHLFTAHQLNKDGLRGLGLAKLRRLHDDLHAGKHPRAVITHTHGEVSR